MDELKKNELNFMQLFDCFAKVTKLVTLLDGSIGYIVDNKHEGINSMLVRQSECYDTVRGF